MTQTVQIVNPLPIPVEIVSGGGGGSSGGLTDVELRASAVPVSVSNFPAGFNVNNWPAVQVVSVNNLPATQPVSGTVAVNNFPASQPVTGAFYQATQPVSIAASVAVTGPLTDTQLRATAVPVSGPLTDTQLRAANVPVAVQNFPATQPVSIAASVAVTGPLTDTQLRAAAVPVSGAFWQATQPVSGPLTDTQLRASAVPVSGPLTDTQLRASAVPVSGPLTDTQLRASAVPVSGPLTDTQLRASAVPISALTLTKGTQGANGLSTQDLKDAGRVSVCISTVIAGVAGVTSEALVSMVAVRDGVAAAAATTFAVTAGKRFRIQAIHVSARSTSAAVFSARFGLRMNPSGAAAVGSPLLGIISCTQQAAALAEAGDSQSLPIPDGLEISGTQQIGMSQLCSATTGVVYITIIGYEY